MKLSRISDYAVRAVVNMATKEKDSRIKMNEIAEEEGIPSKFLPKIIQALAASGIVKGFRGRGGGVILSKDASEISLNDVIEAVNGPIQMNRCQTEGAECTKEIECAIHGVWAGIQDVLVRVLKEYKVSDVAANYTSGNKITLCEIVENISAIGKPDHIAA